jgi:hypothetical protein
MPTERAFARGMAVLAAAYPEFNLQPATLQVYRDRLARVSDQDFEAAINRHLDSSKWFPKVSELLAQVEALSPPLLGSDSWGRLLEAAERSLPQPDLTPLELMALRSIGGWDRLCLSSYDDLKFRRREYLSALEDSQGQEIYHDDGRNILDEAAQRRQRMIE